MCSPTDLLIHWLREESALPITRAKCQEQLGAILYAYSEEVRFACSDSASRDDPEETRIWLDAFRRICLDAVKAAERHLAKAYGWSTTDLKGLRQTLGIRPGMESQTATANLQKQTDVLQTAYIPLLADGVQVQWPPVQLGSDFRDSVRVLSARAGALCWALKSPLTEARYKAIERLIDAGEEGLTKDGLERRGLGGARRSLSALVNRDADWQAIIHFPGKARDRYRLVMPKTPTKRPPMRPPMHT